MTKIPKLIATSVVRGSQQGESHGGIYLIDFENQDERQMVDWNSGDIDFSGRGWDRGLRGIAFHRSEIYIAASDELFVYDKQFRIQRSFRNRYLKHCHEIAVRDGLMLLTSTGFDSLLVFDLKRQSFVRGLCITRKDGEWAANAFDPNTGAGPIFNNELHINSVSCNKQGIFVSGLRMNAMLRVGAKFRTTEYCSLPVGTHNAQPYRDGIIFNDTNTDAVRYVQRDGGEAAFPVQTYDPDEIEFFGVNDSNVARQAFGRGLCSLSDSIIAAGSSPSTISYYDLDSQQRIAAVNLSMDIRNAIHGLEVWPFA